MRTRKKGREKHTSEALYRILLFLVKFNLFAIPLYIILFFNLQWAGLERVTADIVQLVLQQSMAVERAGNFLAIPVQNGTWGAFINWDCTGWKSFLAFFALVMATGYETRKKLYGLAVFIPLLFIVNIARIAFMFHFVRAFDLAYFDLVHALIWSWGMIFAILLFWAVWMRYFPGKRKPVKSKARQH